ncbi:MAG: GGDEF domain-containing protein [bacterium]|nr:GGDEF domain-containing protein [bacterium]
MEEIDFKKFFNDWEQEHGLSLGMLFENIFKKIQYGELNEKLTEVVDGLKDEHGKSLGLHFENVFQKMLLQELNDKLQKVNEDLEDEHGKSLALLFENVYQRVLLAEKNKELEKIVVIDGLTELYNHKYMVERLAYEIEKARRYAHDLSIVMLDIDYFKKINDTYGHQAGDNVLIQIAALFKKNFRKADIIGRYGGEEFIVVMPYTCIENGFNAAERLRKSTESYQWDISELSVTISGGICSYDHDDASDINEFIKKADTLLYKAKDEGRNRILR